MAIGTARITVPLPAVLPVRSCRSPARSRAAAAVGVPRSAVEQVMPMSFGPLAAQAA